MNRKFQRKQLLVNLDNQKNICLDAEELRLTFCLALCKIGNLCDILSFARPLEEMYNFWLHRHCEQFYSNGAIRASRLSAFVDQVLYSNDYRALANEFSMTPVEMIQNVLG
uniref:DNA-binding protein n=1 Tax=Syphacia muris TaxID=451379 RepID=A0A0N5A9B8_9BILA